MSLEAFRALGEIKHAEYYDGLCVVNPPDRSHERVVARLRRAVEAVCPANLEVHDGWGWETGSGHPYVPDLMVCETDAADRDVLRFPPPVLVVEVCSPSTRDADWGRKLDDYGGGGASWYWIVERSTPEIVVFENTGGRMVERARVIRAATMPGPLPATVDPTGFDRL